jgi:hypothetical protein
MTDLSALGARSEGVWTRAAARTLLSRSQVDALVKTGAWQVPYRGVYADGGYDLTPEQLAYAAVFASDATDVPTRGRTAVKAVPCGRTAARLWGFPLVDDDDPATGATESLLEDVHTTTRPGTAVIAGSGARAIHRHHLSLVPGDLARHRSGLWLTSPLRTALDCAVLLPHEAAVCVLDHGLRVKAFTAAELQAALRQRYGWPGVRAQTRAVAAADGRAESPAETLARLLLLPVLPGLEPQVRLFDDRGSIVARFDLGDRALRLAVEVDGRRGHAGTQMVAKDRRRDRRTEALGWWTERATWYDIRRRQEELRARVVERTQRRR